MQDIQTIYGAICTNIEKNNAGECDARAGYFQLIGFIETAKEHLPTEDHETLDGIISDIKGIVSEEKKHTNILQKAVTVLSGIMAE
jgi:hypothetical protein